MISVPFGTPNNRPMQKMAAMKDQAQEKVDEMKENAADKVDEVKENTEMPDATRTSKSSGKISSDQQDEDSDHDDDYYPSPFNDHAMQNYDRGQSQVERLAKKIEKRRQDRVRITFKVRKEFLHTCYDIAVQKGYSNRGSIRTADLMDYKDRVEGEMKGQKQASQSTIKSIFGILCHECCHLDVLERAVEVAQKEETGSDWFQYQDFNYFHTVLVSRWPWMRNFTISAICMVIFFYLVTSVLFCNILQDDGVCLDSSETGVPGWVSAMYFGSVSMSTAGYGNLVVTQDHEWQTLIACLYIVFTIFTAAIAFSAAAHDAFTPISNLMHKVLHIHYPTGPFEEGEYLYERLRKIKFIRLGEIFLQLTVLQLVGIFASRIAIRLAGDDEAEQWSWLTSLYYTLQTTRYFQTIKRSTHSCNIISIPDSHFVSFSAPLDMAILPFHRDLNIFRLFI